MKTTQSGKQVQLRRVHQNQFMAYTQPLWIPAFSFMEKVMGYHYHGYVAAYEDSEFLYYR